MMDPMHLLPTASTGVRVVEIACDESGSEGEKLIGGTTDVFAHASLDVDVAVAVACIDEVRVRARSRAEELKASVVLREQNRAVLEDLLGAAGPFHGNAHVHLTEKVFLLAGKLVELLGRASVRQALVLYTHGPDTFGAAAWRDLLGAFNELMRAKFLEDARAHASSYVDLASALGLAHAGTPAGDIVATTASTVPTTDTDLLHLLDKSRRATVLDPLVPALASAVGHWGSDGRAVSVVHDEQRSLRESGLAHLDASCAPEGSLVGIRFVDSRDDPRVQLADFLAGAARRIASEELVGRGDPGLTSLLRPYVDPGSVWGDPRSRSVLVPPDLSQVDVPGSAG